MKQVEGLCNVVIIFSLWEWVLRRLELKMQQKCKLDSIGNTVLNDESIPDAREGPVEGPIGANLIHWYCPRYPNCTLYRIELSENSTARAFRNYFRRFIGQSSINQAAHAGDGWATSGKRSEDWNFASSQRILLHMQCTQFHHLNHLISFPLLYTTQANTRSY